MVQRPIREPGRTAIQPLVISAPFGNYVQPAGATATLGTFTAMRRGGVASRIWRVLATVRYYPRMRAWVNRIGLQNPGIDWLVKRVATGRVDVADKLVSIHGFTDSEWYTLLERIAGLDPLGVELNMSCPNVGHVSWPDDLFERAVATGVPVIVKVPPVNYDEMVDRAHAAGVRTFHCCNTLPNPGGGMSGKPLKPLSLQCIQELGKRPYFAEIAIIGGGGVYEPGDIDEYARVGARHVAIATKLFNPICLITDRPIRPLIRRAHELLSDHGGAAPGHC
jgi:dihydroorotate dehydrogenase